MAEPNVTRRLAAIVAADVAGYSRLVSADEEGTFSALRRHRIELIDPKITEYRGRIANTAGDSILIEFLSVVDALRCAIDVQNGMVERNKNIPEDRQILFRVGVNLGDVIEQEGDLLGDGVNVAARLEGLAEPGGICISRAARDQVRDRMEIALEDLGEVEVKNMARPVRSFRLRLDGSSPPTRTVNRLRWQGPVATLAILVSAALAAGGFWWWQPWWPDVKPAAIENMAFPLPDKPSIAVLPFANLSDAKDQEYFADGMTEDIITDLSKISGLFVISRNSTFFYKGRTFKVSEVAEELGVRFVLEGSVRRAGNQVRINAQLIDATTGGHLWAERYDGSLDDIFALQDQVTKRIVTALSINLTAQDRLLRSQVETQNPEAYDIFLRGWSHYRRNTPVDYAKAIPYLKQAIALDPEYRRAYATLAVVYWNAFANARLSRGGEWVRSLDLSLTGTFDEAVENLKLAKQANPPPLAYQVSSGMYVFQGQYDEALAEASQAVALDGNDPAAYEALGTVSLFAGNPQGGFDAFRTAIRLDPQYAYIYQHSLGLALFTMDRFEEAAEVLVNASRRNPDDERVLIPLAASYGMLGRIDDAKKTVQRLNDLRRLNTDRLSQSGLRPGIDLYLFGPLTLQDMDLWPFKERADRERLREGLRRIGVPERGPSDAESPLHVPGAVTVDAAAAKALFDRGAKFIDVRGPSWNLGHISGAAHLFLKDAFTEEALASVASQHEEVVIYCQGPACLLSSAACAQAVSWGYQSIYYFRDGFPSWQAAKYPVEHLEQ